MELQKLLEMDEEFVFEVEKMGLGE